MGENTEQVPDAPVTMPPGRTTPRRASTAQTVVRMVAGVICAVIAVPLVWAALHIAGSLWGDGSSDPHGYVRVFGSMIAMVLLAALAVVLPFTFPPGKRLLAGFLCVAGLLVAILATIVVLTVSDHGGPPQKMASHDALAQVTPGYPGARPAPAGPGEMTERPNVVVLKTTVQ